MKDKIFNRGSEQVLNPQKYFVVTFALFSNGEVNSFFVYFFLSLRI